MKRVQCRYGTQTNKKAHTFREKQAIVFQQPFNLHKDKSYIIKYNSTCLTDRGPNAR